MHVIELETLIEHELADVVQSHFPLDWREDAITHELMIRLRSRFHDVTLRGLHYPLQLQWEAYKLHGWREQQHGDVGVLLQYALPTGDVVEAAGFLEAKLRSRDSTKFKQVRHEQVQRILETSRHTRLLMYDYDLVPVLGEDGALGWDLGPHPFAPLGPQHALVTHGPVVPLELAAAINQYDDGLYRFSHSLSHQLVRRFFQLHDVDFGEAAVAAVKGFPAELAGGDNGGQSPNVVMVVRAAVLGQRLPERSGPNSNIYGPLEGRA